MRGFCLVPGVSWSPKPGSASACCCATPARMRPGAEPAVPCLPLPVPPDCALLLLPSALKGPLTLVFSSLLLQRGDPHRLGCGL